MDNTEHLLANNPFQNSTDIRQGASAKPNGFANLVNELRGTIFRNRWLVLASVFAGLALGIVYLNVATKRYTASMMVAPANNQSVNMMMMMGSSPLASLARGALGGGADVSPFETFQQEISANDVAVILMADPEIAHVVFETEWDAQAQAYHEPDGFLASSLHSLSTMFGGPEWAPPNSDRMKLYIEQNVKVAPVQSTGLVSLSFAHKSGAFATRFLLKLYQAADGVLRQQELAKSTAYINFLTRELDRVTNTEQRQSLIQLLSTQENTRMVSSVDVPFSATVIEAPHAPTKPTSPQAALGLVGIPLIFAGFWVGVLWLFRRRSSRA